ncbi:MAG: ATP-binding protein [Chitinophagaceae bacterium]|nr:ATP-binding protein [Chitinophagaceae bacterium]
MIRRAIIDQIIPKIADNKAIIIYGPRQAGKSTLLKALHPHFQTPVLSLNGDETDVRSLLKDPTSTRLRQIIGQARTLVIDEAQRIENIGLCLKLIVDNIPGVKVIVTGSSAFELSNSINEPLTGRKWEFYLYPIAFEEMVAHSSLIEEKRLIEGRLLFGAYPEIILNPGQEKERLSELTNSYLYKDILTWERIQKPEKMERLIQALAFQVGQEVSYNELGQMTGLDNQTTEKYIQLLEKTFILFRLGSLSRNLRNELKKSRKIYFVDNGIRNAVVSQYNPLGLRTDTGALWENYLMSERLKWLANHKIHGQRYFWRTHAQQEIDYVEERDGQLNAFEFKWKPGSTHRIPSSFIKAYPDAITKVIDPGNMEEFLLSFLK